MREVEWLGGPQDGGRFSVPTDARWVEVYVQTSVEHGSLRTTLASEPIAGVQRVRVPITPRYAVWARRTEEEQ